MRGENAPWLFDALALISAVLIAVAVLAVPETLPRRLLYVAAVRGHLVNVHAVVGGMSVSIRQVGGDSPAIAQWIIVRDLCGRAS
ncbi:hypothetical protein ACWDSD_40500 [Streptomyces spiralis]